MAMPHALPSTEGKGMEKGGGEQRERERVRRAELGAREARINHPRLHHTPSLPAPREQATDRHLVVLDRPVRRTLAGLPVQQARPCTCGSHSCHASLLKPKASYWRM
jgi:hypothetical protein